MGELSKMPNIGEQLEKQLNQVGIETVEQLIDVGSKEAWARIKQIDSSACINRLCALEGAIMCIRWHNLDDRKKQDLKSFYNSFKGIK